MISYQFPHWVLAAGLAGALTGCAALGQCNSDRCRNDAKITAKVRALFDQYPVLGPPNTLTVQTMNGVVYLNGAVSTYLQGYMAEAVALRAPGVASVVNGTAVAGR